MFVWPPAFPTLFSSHLVLHEVVGNYSHLFWVPGTDLSLVPYMLLAHIDVVPANESDGWDAPPFSAKEIDGFIYGRGAIDNKQSVMVRELNLFLVFFMVLLCSSSGVPQFLSSDHMAILFEGNSWGAGVSAVKGLYATTRLLRWPGTRWRGNINTYCKWTSRGSLVPKRLTAACLPILIWSYRVPLCSTHFWL